jgi:inosose dehydratase
MTEPTNIAINPLPWFIGPGGIEVTVDKVVAAMTDLGRFGYRALSTRVPAGMSEVDYLALLAERDFRPAPGYFSANFERSEDRSAILDEARRHAASEAALGLTESFVGSGFMPERLAQPAVGLGSSETQTARVAELLATCADLAHQEGVSLALHPHIASAVETEAEIRSVLDQSAGSALKFGPDTGHLAWAGADLTGLFVTYSDRIVALHLKDVDESALRSARAQRSAYFDATKVGHLWTEPGRGSIDFDALLRLLPPAFEGWFVVEVDVPNLPTAVESSEFAGRYVTELVGNWADGRR